MAIIRDRYAEVVSARGPTNRELMGDGSRSEHGANGEVMGAPFTSL